MVGEMARMARAKASPRSRQSRNWPKLGPVGDGGRLHPGLAHRYPAVTAASRPGGR